MSRYGYREYPSGDQPHYVYRCYDMDGRLIYVGCTRNPIGRLATHRSTAWWAHQIHSTRLIVFPDRPKALRMEREAIGEEQPRWNIKSRWNHRSLWTADDYADYHQALQFGAIHTPPTMRHIERVRVEAKRRYGIELEEVAA